MTISYRKQTIRKMPGPLGRKLARLANEHASMGRRLKNLIKEVKELEGRQAKINQKTEDVLDRIKGE